MQADPTEKYQQVQGLAEEIGRRCQEEVDKLGFERDEVLLRAPEDASFYLEKDPSNGEYNLVGDWLDKKGFKQGMLVFHADGSFYVEQDIVQPHPRKKKWFVEGINAWGKGQEIKVEARLLPMPG
jgi:hypothetical protein